MCGICGVVSFKGLDENDIGGTRRANAAMFHRGPDGHGELLAGQKGEGERPHMMFAMRRLSIIDLEHGWQPLFNEDRKLVLVANGEIYNHQELRSRLEATGRHRFQSRSDCEVILHLYEEHGLDFVKHLRGMFALALWDDNKRRLVLARDRMGEKPLYICRRVDRIVFASEMKSLLEFGGVEFDLDPVAVDQYLRYGWVPDPKTPIKGVVKIPPATMLIVDIDQWQIKEYQYWSIEAAPIVSGPPAQVVRDVLEETMPLMLRADVPVGIALSGGLDSSIIAAMAARTYGERLQAFTVGYRESHVGDEREHARQLARVLKIKFHEIEISEDDVVNGFDELVRMRDEPICDPAGYGYFAVARAAREKNCPVLLQGQGADELFWGYPWAADACMVARIKALGGAWWNYVAHALLGRRPLSIHGLKKLLHFSAGYASGWRTTNFVSSIQRGMALYDLNVGYERGCAASRAVLNVDFIEQAPSKLVGRDIYAVEGNADGEEVRIISALCRSYLLQNGLTQGDRLTMANSVELRLPFTDYRLVESIVGLHKSHAAPLDKPKDWLIEAIRDLLPAEVIQRRKRGFTPPVRQWTRRLRERYMPQLLDGYLVGCGVASKHAVKKMQHDDSIIGNWNEAGSRILVLESWCRQLLCDG